MPLKLIKRGKSYYVRGTVAGAVVYESAKTSNRREAEGYLSKRESQLYDRRIHGERSTIGFDEAALSYVEANPPAKRESVAILKLSEYFGSTLLKEIDQVAVDKACDAILKRGAAPATKIRGVITPLTAILIHAARRNWCDAPKFDRPAVRKTETPWLAPRDALRLVECAEPHLRPLLRFLLCTGARLAEALELNWNDVSLHDKRATFRQTKNGRPRHANLPAAAVVELANLKHREGVVFRRPDGKPYADRNREEGGQIKRSFTTACRRAGLGEFNKKTKKFDPSITPHGLRHTWATWFYAITKDPFLLRNEGGWSTIAMVERYAHLMKSELTKDIALVWGDTHPTIGDLPGSIVGETGAKSVHQDLAN
jgi:integrase